MQATTSRRTLHAVPDITPVQDEESARVEACAMLAEAYRRVLKVPGLSADDRRWFQTDLAAAERMAGRRVLEAI